MIHPDQPRESANDCHKTDGREGKSQPQHMCFLQEAKTVVCEGQLALFSHAFDAGLHKKQGWRQHRVGEMRSQLSLYCHFHRSSVQ